MSASPSNSAVPARATPRSAAQSHAFTLLELIVVITIIAILAGVFLPRFTGQGQRAAEAEAVAVHRLLSAAAERASLVGGQRLAIEFSTLDGVSRLAVMARTESTSTSNSSGKGSSGGAAGSWKQDLLVDPVTFSRLEITQAMVDGRRLDTRRWLVPLGGAQIRPTMTIVLGPVANATPTAYRIELPPDAVVALRTPMPAGQMGVAGSRAIPAGPPTRSIDLDATGRGDSPW